jgi:hypothetical protein
MVWGFCYLRIFKKMHSISGRSLHISFHFGCEPFFTKFEMLCCKMILKQKVINKCHFDVFLMYFNLNNTK